MCPGGVPITVLSATEDKAAYHSGAGNDAGTAGTNAGKMSQLFPAELITYTHISYTASQQPPYKHTQLACTDKCDL